MIEFNNKVKARVSEEWVGSVVGKVLKELKLSKMTVSIVLVGDREIKRLNKLYRKSDRVTDVLSFSNLEGKRLAIPGQEEYLGEVIIGYEQAGRQAREQGHSTKKELVVLLVHGILHLLKYEHERGGREAEVMRRKEAVLLEKLRGKSNS